MTEALPIPPGVAAVLILVTRWGLPGLVHFLQATIFMKMSNKAMKRIFALVETVRQRVEYY